MYYSPYPLCVCLIPLDKNSIYTLCSKANSFTKVFDHHDLIAIANEVASRYMSAISMTSSHYTGYQLNYKSTT